MSKQAETRFAISFKLNGARLKKLYPSAHYKNGWRMLAEFLEKKGFEKKGRFFISKKTMAANDCMQIVLQMSKKFRWFSGAVRDIQIVPTNDPVCLLDMVRKAG